jgi:hypothetical protein
MDAIIQLIIPFVALAILSAMIDKFTLFLESIMHRIPGLPDKFEWWIAYVIIVILGFIVCWQGSFDLFDYLDLHFAYMWEGWLMTALVISGGSAFVRTNFSLIEAIAMTLVGAAKGIISIQKPSSSSSTPTPVPTDSSQQQPTNCQPNNNDPNQITSTGGN